MARRPITVHKIQEITRLNSAGLSLRQIAKTLGLSRKTVRKHLEVGSITETSFWAKEIDWQRIKTSHQELGVPLSILWQELFDKEQVPVNYASFWKQFNKRFDSQNVTMARHFRPGERLEIDYCDGINIIHPSGEIQKTHLFVGVLCYSRYTYAEFSYSQKSHDFLNSHVRMFQYFGGVPRVLSPDNLKSAVIKSNRYDPDLNPAYVRLAEHYGLVVEPARVRRPKDKAIVERTIQIFQKWFYFVVRDRTFRSLIELNKCLWEHLEIFNKKMHRILKCSRFDKFLEEKNYLNELTNGYIVQVHKRCTLHSDCHLEFDHNYYSAPWKLRGKTLDVWATGAQVQIYFEGSCVAIHERKNNRGKFATQKDHYPPNHQAYLEITPCHLRQKAKEIGPWTFKFMEELLPEDRPLRYLRRAQGLVALLRKYSPEDIERGCEKALSFQKLHLTFIEQVIKSRRNLNQSEQITRSAKDYLRGEKLLN